ncbi:hypothetical protein OAT01_11670 [Pseudomonadales bacterium]|nr:hypothetical protein [Pseudomonadales bacterium]
MTRVIDGGSGFLANNQYQILVGLPFDDHYRIETKLPSGRLTVQNISAGDNVTIFADGTVQVNGLPSQAHHIDPIDDI